jgi:hypothetical protein
MRRRTSALFFCALPEVLVAVVRLALVRADVDCVFWEAGFFDFAGIVFSYMNLIRAGQILAAIVPPFCGL